MNVDIPALNSKAALVPRYFLNVTPVGSPTRTPIPMFFSALVPTFEPTDFFCAKELEILRTSIAKTRKCFFIV